jgi:hypothetical protein
VLYDGFEMGEIFFLGFCHLPVCGFETKLASFPDSRGWRMEDGGWMMDEIILHLTILDLSSEPVSQRNPFYIRSVFEIK